MSKIASMTNAIPKRLLIVAPAHVGDILMISTLLKLIKQTYPDVQLDVLAPQATLPLLSFMPDINQGILIPCAHGDVKLWTRYKIAKELRSKHYDVAILFQNSFKSALIPFLANIPKRIGYNRECRRLLLTDSYPFERKKSQPYVGQQSLLLEKIGIHTPDNNPFPSLSVNQEQKRSIIAKFNLNIQKPILTLCPGAQYGPTKQWPAEYFSKVAQNKIDEGWDVWILGAEWDKKISHQIRHDLKGNSRDFTGHTTLEEVITLLSFAHTVLSNDSGLMHIAAALDKKIIALYGSSSATYTPPLTHTATIVSLHLACSPCFQKKCPLGHYDCLKKLTPDMLPDF